jgi:hypothetical protein
MFIKFLVCEVSEDLSSKEILRLDTYQEAEFFISDYLLKNKDVKQFEIKKVFTNKN